MHVFNHNQFAPECLTISLGSDCNLNCLYCYAKDKRPAQEDRLEEEEFLQCIQKAAEIVASNCRAKNIPFHLGFQGSGEPLMYFQKLKKIFERVSRLAQESNVHLLSFITSNGCMEAHQYRWLAHNFSRICISLDGDQNNNDAQRQGKNKESLYEKIVETIGILKQNDKTPVIRTTVTKFNVDNLVPIVDHFINDLNLTEIQVEPVYLIRQRETLAPYADAFVRNYLQAKERADKSGGTLSYSGLRKNQNHGAYCNMDKNVLFIGANGNASICLFKDHEKKSSPYVIGYFDAKNNQYVIDHEKISALKKLSNRLYPDCEKCGIQNSCVRGCPDICLFENEPDNTIRNCLRCKINRLLHQNEK